MYWWCVQPWQGRKSCHLDTQNCFRCSCCVWVLTWRKLSTKEAHPVLGLSFEGEGKEAFHRNSELSTVSPQLETIFQMKVNRSAEFLSPHFVGYTSDKDRVWIQFVKLQSLTFLNTLLLPWVSLWQNVCNSCFTGCCEDERMLRTWSTEHLLNTE